MIKIIVLVACISLITGRVRWLIREKILKIMLKLPDNLILVYTL